jgi:hypothetical protein
MLHIILQLLRIIFSSWWEDMAWKRRALQLEHLLASRRQHTLLVISLHSWMHSTFENLLLTNAKIQNDLFEAKVYPYFLKFGHKFKLTSANVTFPIKKRET